MTRVVELASSDWLSGLFVYRRNCRRNYYRIKRHSASSIYAWLVFMQLTRDLFAIAKFLLHGSDLAGNPTAYYTIRKSDALPVSLRATHLLLWCFHNFHNLLSLHAINTRTEDYNWAKFALNFSFVGLLLIIIIIRQFIRRRSMSESLQGRKLQVILSGTSWFWTLL